jgi:hypothetical protein
MIPNRPADRDRDAESTALVPSSELRQISFLPESDHGVRLVSSQPWAQSSSSLLEHCSVDLRGLIIEKIPLFRQPDGGLGAGSPSCPQLDSDGHHRVDPTTGKRLYTPILRFADMDARRRWTKLVLAALQKGGVAP